MAARRRETRDLLSNHEGHIALERAAGSGHFDRSRLCAGGYGGGDFGGGDYGQAA